MLGWEFPPYFAGGVGMVCYELTKAFSKREDINVTYLMPFGPKELGDNNHVKLMVANNLISNKDINNIKIKRVSSLLGAYDSFSSYTKRLNEFKNSLRMIDNGPAKALYGGDLLTEVHRFAEKAQLVAMLEDFDVIHAHDWTTFPAAMAIKNSTGKPFIAHVHITEYDKSGGLGANPDIYHVERQGMHAADKVIVVSNFVKNNIMQRYGVPEHKIRVVHNGGVEMKKNAENFKINDGCKYVLFAGRVTLQKGPEFFLEAARRVLEKEDNVKFILAGSGDQLNMVIEKAAEMGIANKFMFTGFYNRDEAEKLFSMADVFVMPSVSEPFGIVPLEAMYKGTPTIISKQSGVSEVINHCMKVDFWDIDEMANQILSVIKYKPLQHSLSENGLREVQAFGWEKPAEKCMNVYNEVI